MERFRAVIASLPAFLAEAALAAGLLEQIVFRGERVMLLRGALIAFFALVATLLLPPACKYARSLLPAAGVMAAGTVLAYHCLPIDSGADFSLIAGTLLLVILAQRKWARPAPRESLLFNTAAALLGMFQLAVILSSQSYAQLLGEPSPESIAGLALVAVFLTVLIAAALIPSRYSWWERIYNFALVLGGLALFVPRTGTAGLPWREMSAGAEGNLLIALVLCIGRVLLRVSCAGRSLTPRASGLVLLGALALAAAFTGRAAFRVATLPLPQSHASTILNQKLLAYLLVAEDPNFFSHRGVDARRIRDAMEEYAEKGRFGRGGSTITMQLCKVLWLSFDKTVMRKLDQIVTALILEMKHTKEEILGAYLAAVPFAKGVRGIEAAAFHYYSRPLSDLNSTQLLELVLTIYDPAEYNPNHSAESLPTRIRAGTIKARAARAGGRLLTDIRKRR